MLLGLKPRSNGDKRCKRIGVRRWIRRSAKISQKRYWIGVNFVEATGRCCPRCSMWEIRMLYKSDVKAKAGVAQIRKEENFVMVSMYTNGKMSD
ncbi:hypothetical protein Mgra_00004874 [Meloidogyne graminicola]|uniref:Uncharacterized protein n=1 Tax=Meloidogyne graminicola TaxID=189291 RepID=A0A8S9ZRB6_9BILA|nr:hypothetical protein Mgra_00004874 [Meloidogyne graminicola]